MSIANAKAHFTECVRSTEQGGTVLITRHGRPVAALVSVEEFERMEERREDQGGLASLAGSWQGGAELAASIEQVRTARTRPRALPRRR